MIFIVSLHRNLIIYAHEKKTENGVYPTFHINFCTAQERLENADEKKSNK